MILTKDKITSVDLDKEVLSKINSGKSNQLLLIVPTNRKIRSLRREIISSSPNSAAGRLNLETIGSFAEKLSTYNSQMLGEASSIVLLNQCFRETELKYFSSYEEEIPYGTLQRVKNVISEYKRQGISPDVLRKESEQLNGSEKLNAKDIENVYRKYNERCLRLGVKEIGDVYQEIISKGDDNFFNKFKSIYDEVNLIIVNGFDEFTNPEIEIINLASGLDNVKLLISFDYHSGNSAIFSHLDKCYKKFIERGFKEVSDISTDTQNDFQRIIRNELFNNSDRNKLHDYCGTITKITSQTREKEVETIAKEIKKIIVEHRVEPHNICLAFNLIQNYSPLIRYYFPLYGLPFNLTDRFPLSTSPPVVSIINFLEIIENDFYYKNIFRALSGKNITPKSFDLSSLLKASVKLKIIAGYDNWRNSLLDAINNTVSNDDEDSKNYEYDKILYKNALKNFEELHYLLSPFLHNMTVKKFLERLNDLILNRNFASALLNQSEENIEVNAKAVTVFLDETAELFGLIESEYGDNKKFPLRFFLNNIRTAVNASRFNVREKPGYGVQITTLNEIRGLKFDYLFIAGLTDGDFPTRFSPEIFFSGSFAKSELIHQIENRYHFYQSLCSWNKKLYLTLPQHKDNTELVESNFLNEFTSLFKVDLKSENDYEEYIFSKEDILINAGKSIASNFTNINLERELESAEVSLDEIKKVIEINKLRAENPFAGSPYTGSIGNELTSEAKERLSEFKERNYSITQLETYALCPFKYFAERVLRIEPVKEPTEEIEAIELGSLLHDIFFEFYSRLKKENIILQNSSDEDFNYAYNLIFKIAEEKISQANFKSPMNFYEKEKIMGINGSKANSILFKFLVEERKNNEGFTPMLFESSFGDRQANENSFEVNGIKLNGKIDRIDIDESNKKYNVIDYKLSGKKPSRQDLENGLSLQLPLYLYAAENILLEKFGQNFNPSDAFIYSLKPSTKDFGNRQVIKENNASVLIGICIDSIKKYVDDIVEGKFTLSALPDRENKICRFCGFKPVCRIQDVK